MSDDVKVKFSGDFSDVPKGAAAAAKSAGSAMSGWFGEIGSSAMGAVGGMFAASAVFSKLMDKFSEAGDYFRTLIHTMHTTGASAVELQKIGAIGKTVGIGFEVVGKSLGLFSKYMGNASKDATNHGKVLRELGFGNERITAGTITATEVLEALAVQLEETGNAYLVAANATAIFGRSGRELMPIIRMGKQQIKEQGEEVKTYSEGQVQAIDASERRNAKLARSSGGFFKGLYNAFMHDKGAERVAIDNIRNAALEAGREREKAEGYEPNDERIRQSKQYRQDIIKRLKGKGYGYEWMKESMSRDAGKVMAGKAYAAPEGFLEEVQLAELADKKKIEDAQRGGQSLGAPIMSTSSLQSIGGGDIGSIMSGFHVDLAQESLDVQKQIAQNTAPPPPGSAKTITPVAK